MARKCIVCQKEVSVGGGAVRVQEDLMIRSIRRAKETLRIAKGNELYVCAADLKVHADKRKAYEKNVMIYAVVGGAAFLVLAGLPLISGRFNLGFIAGAMFLSALIVLVPVFFKYVPAAEEPAQGQKKAVRAGSRAAKKR